MKRVFSTMKGISRPAKLHKTIYFLPYKEGKGGRIAINLFGQNLLAATDRSLVRPPPSKYPNQTVPYNGNTKEIHHQKTFLPPLPPSAYGALQQKKREKEKQQKKPGKKKALPPLISFHFPPLFLQLRFLFSNCERKSGNSAQGRWRGGEER